MDQEEIPQEWCPRELVNHDNSHHLNKNELSRNKKLSFYLQKSLNAENSWAVGFRDDIKSSKYRSVTEVKDAAVMLWKQYSNSYDEKRAVHVHSLNGRGHKVKRSRRSTETEAEYRKRIKHNDGTAHTAIAKKIAENRGTVEKILSMKRGELLEEVDTRQSEITVLKRHLPMPTKTVHDSMITVLLADMLETLSR